MDGLFVLGLMRRFPGTSMECLRVKRFVDDFPRLSGVVFVVLLFSAFRSYGDTLTYKVVDGVRDWSDTDGWFIGSAAAGRLPKGSDPANVGTFALVERSIGTVISVQ